MKRTYAFFIIIAFLLCCPQFCPPSYAITTAERDQNRETIYTYLTQTLGMTRAAACGILSNIRSESNFNPEAIGDSGEAYGICQWNSRRESLIKYCANNGYEDWTSLEGQLGYLAYELLNNELDVGEYLKTVPDTAQGAYDAAYTFCVKFERPASAKAKGVLRGTTAVNTYYKAYGGSVSEYTITYNPNGGSGAPASGKKTEGVPYLITSLAPVKAGFELAGWSESANANRVDYAAGDNFTDNRNAVLYAVWERSIEAETPCDRKTVYDGHTYEYYSGAHTWANAQRIASLKGGRLASVRNAGEYAAVSELIKGYEGSCWLGGVYVNGNWMWQGGEAFSDSFAAALWESDHPTAVYGENANGRLAQSQDGKWLDLSNEYIGASGFVVEYGSADAEVYQTYLLCVSSSLNLRQGPGTGYSVITSMPRGATITIYDTVPGSSYDWGWGVCSTGASGWCAMKIPAYMVSVSGVDEATGLAYELGEAGLTVVGYVGSAETVTVPETIGSFNVVEIKAGAFKSGTTLRGGAGSPAHYAAVRDGLKFEIVRPEGAFSAPLNINEIGASAFEGLSQIEYLDLSNTPLTVLGENAFAGCINLRVVLLPSTLVNIAESVFPDSASALFVCEKGTYSDSWARFHGYDVMPYSGA